jgi:hypothetical protein
LPFLVLLVRAATPGLLKLEGHALPGLPETFYHFTMNAGDVPQFVNQVPLTVGRPAGDGELEQGLD